MRKFKNLNDHDDDDDDDDEVLLPLYFQRKQLLHVSAADSPTQKRSAVQRK